MLGEREFGLIEQEGQEGQWASEKRLETRYWSFLTEICVGIAGVLCHDSLGTWAFLYHHQSLVFGFFCLHCFELYSSISRTRSKLFSADFCCLLSLLTSTECGTYFILRIGLERRLLKKLLVLRFPRLLQPLVDISLPQGAIYYYYFLYLYLYLYMYLYLYLYLYLSVSILSI